MRLPVVLRLAGTLLRLFSVMLLAPALVAWYYGEGRDAIVFVATAVGSALTAQLMILAGQEPEDDLRRVEALGVVAGTWIVVAHAAAVPYLFNGMGYIDAFFESMSGLTTTGATIMADFSPYGRGLFFWRAMTQWLGGLGIIALFVAVLPRLSIAGRQLFFAEATGPTDEKVTPQVRKTAGALWTVYAGLTLAQVVALSWAGMTPYDSVCHAFTTLSAGGFSPHPQSIAGYDSAAIEWIIIVFMFLAGANFALYYRALRGERGVLPRDEELRTYVGIIVVAALLIVVLLQAGDAGLLERVRLALFQVLTILTTTGYASADFELWNDQARIVLFVLMFVGGCAGSAAGGPKVVRQILIARYTLLELRRTVHPRGVLPVKLGGRVVPEEVMRAVLVFFLFYLLIFAVCTTIVVVLGADLVTGITAAIASLGNIGPGFGAIGPMESYAGLHPVSKVVLTLAMWVGRLEVVTVLALLRPEVWRMMRWRD